MWFTPSTVSARARRGEGRSSKHPAADRPHVPDAFIQRPCLARGGVRGAGHQLIYDASQRRIEDIFGGAHP